MRRMHSLIRPKFLAITALFLLGAPAVSAQDSGAGGGNPLQGGVSALDKAQERQTMKLNLGSPAQGFIDNPGQAIQGGVHTERVPPEVYRAWLNDNHQRFALTTQTMGNGLVIDVAGRWDHADKTLDKFGINYTHIKTGDITPEVLAGAKVVIINCAGEVRRDRLQFIRDFVQRGGYLLTTDWALNNMVEQTFPGYIDWNKEANDHSIYTASFVSPDPVLAKGCVRSAPWKLDAGAHLIGVRRRDLVRVLISSPDLAREDRDGMGVLACVFPFGKGYVLHMLGHFDNNAAIVFGNLLPDPAPGIKISLRQALAVNFVVAGLTGEPIPGQTPPQGARTMPSQWGPARPSQQMPPQQVPPQPGFLPRQNMPPTSGQTQQFQQAPAWQSAPAAVPALQSSQQDKPPHTVPGQMPPLAPDRLHKTSQ